MKFTFYKQPDQMDCGATCLRMIAKYYGRSISIQKLRGLTETTKQGASLKKINQTADKIGFRTLGVRIPFDKLKKAPTPFIVHWNNSHFVVVYKIKKNKVYVADPAYGLITYKEEEFLKRWINEDFGESKENKGVALLLEPTPKLNKTELDDIEDEKGFSFLYQYLFRYKRFLLQLIIGLFIGSVIQLIFPFLTQSIVDVGIQNQDINFIYVILLAQLFLFIGRTSIEIIRGWILLHLSTRINISLVSDFFIKLMKLPISYFDTKMTGDLLQRINDHQRIEKLLTTSSLNILFSLFNLIIFGGVLMFYNIKIFLVFLIGSFLYFIWIFLFLKRRRELDFKRFSQVSDEQSKVIEMINGMQSIKLHNAEIQKRWSWEYLQARLFQVEIKGLILTQIQTVGSNFINELKNILVTILSAKLVIDGQLTLGMMLSISFIIGQLNSPIVQLIGFVHSIQDAKIALERLSEIHNHKEEECTEEQKINHLPNNNYIDLINIHYRYTGSSLEIIKGLDLIIPKNKITAIVGSSGSGKTTLMKLLLKFYEPINGEIKVGDYGLNNISQEVWRENIGVVMQDGYIFNDTIANNITLGDDFFDREKFNKAVEIANGKDFIENLPLGYNTKIGMEGVGMSGGQKQRLLIARAIYKDPKFIFFDEATSALDAKNERIIMERLNEFFKERTAVVIAHRLSTVKNADQIVVLENGKIIEKGTHDGLLKLKGSYYSLVQNQLELENLNA